MPRIPLDRALSTRPFRVAEGLAAGLTPDRLAGADLLRPFHGVRSAIQLTPAELYAPRLRPGDRYSHTTAAELWGAPLPARLEGLVHVSAAGSRVRARGVLGHRSRGRAVVRRGLPVSSPEQLFVELGTLLTVDELVAVGDSLVLDPRVLDPLDVRPHTTVALLQAACTRQRAGVRRARSALAFVRSGVESPMETALRLLLVRAGIPEPVTGYELPGVGWFDLAWPEALVIAEYDGDQHRTSRQQYERDIHRFDRASELGWRVVRVRNRGIHEGAAETVERVRRALAR